jgi:putative FmdB family regulatory protein
MPLYAYVCDSCGNELEIFCSVADRDKLTETPCSVCGEPIRKQLTTPPIADPVRLGRIKAPEGFRDVLKQIKKRTPGAVIEVDR